MRITIVYDNKTLDPNLTSGWGFSCLVDDDLLFDTGADGRTLLSNMARMGIDPARIGMVVLSHAHGDHTGGLGELLGTGVRPTVYVPHSFPTRFKEDVRSLTTLVEVQGPVEIQPGIYTTGQVGRGLVEQALTLETEYGLVVITGCAHPGVVKMVRSAKDSFGGKVYLVMGGFHLGGRSQRRVKGIIADFRQLGVQKVVPCHCTGDQAIGLFAEEYGDDFIKAGVGLALDIGPKGNLTKKVRNVQ